MSHTPGPWEYRAAGSFVEGEPGDENTFEVPDHVVSVTKDDQGRKVTRFVADCSATTLPNAANARLIAAAPDLLEALREFMDMWGSADSISSSKRAQSRRARMWDLANNAIAKAEGPQTEPTRPTSHPAGNPKEAAGAGKETRE